MNGQDSIIDFKQSNKPKRREWIEDYCLQLSAYAMAHNTVHGTDIQKGVIMMVTPDNYYQEFIIEGEELKKYKHEFLKRVDQYYNNIKGLTGVDKT
jgi:CRISPR/Cas system-associated exonuclease Cas4 (RecB family)